MSTQDSHFIRTFSLVMISLTVLFVVIVIAALVVSGSGKEGDVSQDPRVQTKINDIIKPVATVNTEASAGGAAPAAAGGDFDAAATYQSACFACHGTGAAGAPKVGDKAAWKDRIASGKDSLYNSALNGKGGMPPKGGQASMSDDNIKAIVDYMVSQSK